MNSSRRLFIKRSSMAIAATALFSEKIFASPPPAPLLGIQLYSVRDDMKKDAAGTLKLLSAIGYHYVEHANYVGRKFYGYSAVEFKKLLDGLGLRMLSGHTVMNKNHWDTAENDFTDSWKYTIEDAAVCGQRYVISPSMDEKSRRDDADLKRFMEMFNKSGELCKKSGMKFGYHNHDFEFSEKLNGVKLFDIIMQYTDPILVTQQLDIGNMYHAGGIALDIIKQYPNRFEMMHVKDEIKTAAGKYESTILGKGIIPVKEVIDLGKKSGGTIHFIVEQESYQSKTPIECAKKDFVQMKKWKY